MSALPKPRWTEEAYLALERASAEKHEFIDGEIIAFAGASIDHAIIIQNITGHFFNMLRSRGCFTFTNDVRVRIPSSYTRSYTYPDVVVVCGEREVVDDQGETLLNPTVIVEVLSPSTEALDQTKKRNQYLRLNSLQAYVLVSLDRAAIESYTRQADDGWRYTMAEGREVTFTLTPLAFTLRLADIYDGVTLDEAPPPDA
jgi:Uma2 family endonuclease